MDSQGSEIHVGIIMDGNGRWARARGLPRVAGHRQGAKAVRRVIEAAPNFGIGTLTLYAFSRDNWRRPRPEVEALMKLFLRYLRSECAECVAKGVRIEVIGRRDRLPLPLREAIRDTEYATRQGRTLLVRLAVDYSGRGVILEAARRMAEEAVLQERDGGEPLPVPPEEFSAMLAESMHAEHAGDVDLVIRTGGEQRISDFLLWEAAYAELVFTRTMWPDFNADDLAAAVLEYHKRERRFGGVAEPLPGSEPLVARQTAAYPAALPE
ncbi:MAG: polyprenyl diphosphate synthase [Terriglobales bacterium]